MGVLGIVGIVAGLAVIVLMALAPTLVELNERHPARERDESRAVRANRNRRPLDLRMVRQGPYVRT